MGRRLQQLLEREAEALHLDRHRRRGPRQGPTRPDRREETRQYQGDPSPLPRTWDSASSEADLGKTARRTACGIPDGVGHVEEWQLALDMLDETRSWGIEVPLAVARGRRCCRVLVRGAGPRPELRGGDSTTLSAQPGEGVPVAEPYSGTGRPPVEKYPDRPQSVKQLVIAAGRKAARGMRWREGSRPGTSRSGFKDVLPLRGLVDPARRT
ncbi:transposase [Streptomyces sp. NPDC017979]|uniref:transposase n=1 Tax=Streptomyces sp. NPDC017979 TaxID=3365024 RepID=UPI0037999923